MGTTNRGGRPNSTMDAEDPPTAPLPAVAREPLIVVLDAWEARRRWVARFLSLAHYHSYVPHTTVEAFRWFVQHPVSPQAILLGDLDPADQLYTQWLLQRIVVQRGQQIPVISLAAFLPETIGVSESSFLPDVGSCMALLEVLWQEVPRLLS